MARPHPERYRRHQLDVAAAHPAHDKEQDRQGENDRHHQEMATNRAERQVQDGERREGCKQGERDPIRDQQRPEISDDRKGDADEKRELQDDIERSDPIH